MVPQLEVRSIEFAGSTYRVEVYSSKEKLSFWPLLQFSEADELGDGFCTCSSDKPWCEHLEAALINVRNAKSELLHKRFQNSFWYRLTELVGDHVGYQPLTSVSGEVAFAITAKNAAGKKRVKQWCEKRRKETPENSIKFSNLSQEEITWWKEGRPSRNLRYILSFWADLGKWMLVHEREAKIEFKEDAEGLPTHIRITFPDFETEWSLSDAMLQALIPSLATLDSPLRLIEEGRAQVESIHYDPQTGRLHLTQVEQSFSEVDRIGRKIGEWLYHSRVGFAKVGGEKGEFPKVVERDDIPSFLESHAKTIAPFFKVDESKHSLSYEMRFDSKWQWHFEAYLFEPKDVLSLVKGWVYLRSPQGFFRIEPPLFDEIHAQVAPKNVSTFVNHHRIWLNSQEGFQTHLASIESQLTFEVNEAQGLHFLTLDSSEESDSHDFGDWIYYSKQGFFSKKHVRVGASIYPGLTLVPSQVSDFVKKHREELENLPQFFASTLPISSRSLELHAFLETDLLVKPIFEGDLHVLFFDDVVYLPGSGFSILPAHLRLPEKYQKETVIPERKLNRFLSEELPHLRRHLSSIDPQFKPPSRVNFEIDYLVRGGGGGLKAKLTLLTEIGRLSLAEVWKGYREREQFLFTKSGLLDLSDPQFKWIEELNAAEGTFEFSTLDFLRLDASLGFRASARQDPVMEVTRSVLQELREFSSQVKPNLSQLKSELRLYQQRGLQWLWFLYRNGLSGLLCDDMGLGKTHQAMALLSAAESGRYLVVCPTSVIYHWEDKLARFLPGIKVHTFHGPNRSLAHLSRSGILLTSYGLLRVESEKLAKLSFEVAIYDEIQVAKNPRSRIHMALKKMKARMQLGLTGTPIENNLLELKALFDLVLPSYMPSEKRFKELFTYPIEREFDEEKKELLTRMIRPFVLRRRKSEVLQELPEKSEDKSYCELSDEQKTLYKKALDLGREGILPHLRDRDAPIKFVPIFALLTRLKQICNHPALVAKDPKSYRAHASGKWDLFVELLAEARASQQKVVIFSQYLFMLDMIEMHLKEERLGYAQIRGDTVDRREELRRFQEDPDCVVFIGSLQAAGLGIDLTAASVVILYDRWWNAARENQAIDRVHRIGQKWGVQVYKLITKGTIEEKIDQMITKKGQLMEQVVTVDDQAMLKNFTRSELIDLLTFSA